MIVALLWLLACIRPSTFSHRYCMRLLLLWSFADLLPCAQSYFWQLAQGVGLRYAAYMLPHFGFSAHERIDAEELGRFIRTLELQ